MVETKIKYLGGVIKDERGSFHWYVWIFLLFFAIFIQSKFSLFGTRPELVTALVFLFGMRTKDEFKAAAFGGLGGLIEDVLSGFWGPNMVSKSLTGYLSANIIGGFFVWSPVLGIIGVFFMTIIDGLIVLLVMALKDNPVPVSGWVLWTLFVQSSLNAPLGYFGGGSEYRTHKSEIRIQRTA
ncbi:MAG: hypothetical protein N2257_08590 [Thermodesulfovibrionales bacterium]|nr:hypothetical protein [Thermodesulfovibrionales bacterium]